MECSFSACSSGRGDSFETESSDIKYDSISNRQKGDDNGKLDQDTNSTTDGHAGNVGSTSTTPKSDEMSGIAHISFESTTRHLRFVACFGQQSKSTIVVELLTPRSSKSKPAGISALFEFSLDPVHGKLQRKQSARRLCSHHGLSALVLPLSRQGAVDSDLARLCERSTEFIFSGLNVQMSRGLEDHCQETGRQQVQGQVLFQTGSAVVTRHSNLCGLNLIFHMARDCDYDVEGRPSDTATESELALSPCISDDERIDGGSLREKLAKGLRTIVRTAATSGAAMLYIPCDLYCPTGEGFGTRDFGSLVRDGGHQSWNSFLHSEGKRSSTSSA